jgi:hypothetical protein
VIKSEAGNKKEKSRKSLRLYQKRESLKDFFKLKEIMPSIEGM